MSMSAAEQQFMLYIGIGFLVLIIASLICAKLFRKAADTELFWDAFVLFLVIFTFIGVIVGAFAYNIR